MTEVHYFDWIFEHISQSSEKFESRTFINRKYFRNYLVKILKNKYLHFLK